MVASTARIRDLAAAAPMIVFFVFAIEGFALQIHRDLALYPPPPYLAASILVKSASALFAAVQIVLFVIRTPPVAKTKTWWPRVLAVVGANAALVFLLLPPARPPGPVVLTSSALIVAGTAAAALIASRLGKAFSITPQARVLVTDGPYRFIRHPLYLAEAAATLGFMCQYRQPWSAMVFAIVLLFQFMRMRLEEQVLSDHFPGYRAYAQRTARLLPGVY
jgi:protein-S-isoprenylcysteine O-methyltransferase Ste14